MAAQSNNFVVKNGIVVTTTATVLYTVNATSTATGSLIVAGGAGIGRDLWVGGNVYSNGFQLATATSVINAALNIVGGSTGSLVYQVGPGQTGFIGIGSTGTFLVSNGTTASWQVLNASNTGTTSTFFINNNTQSTATNSGALIVAGGVGIGGALYVGGPAYVNGSQVVTTATLAGYGVTSITAGTDTAVSTSTGGVTVWNISTLQTVTGRGNTTNNPIVITNTASATSTSTGALVVTGGAGIGGSLYVGGTTYLAGDLYVDGTNFIVNRTTIQSGDAVLTLSSATTSSFLAANSGIQIGNTGLPFITWFYDGINSWKSSGGVIVSSTASSTSSNTGALVVAGGVGIGGSVNIGQTSTINGAVIITTATIGQYAGGIGTGASSSGTSSTFVISNTTQSTGTNSGALQVWGGAGIGGNLNVGGSLTVSGNINATVTGVSSSATNITNGTTGSILYQTAPGVTGFIGIGSTNSVLISNGTTPVYSNTLTLGGTISHAGLVPTQGLNIDQIYSTSTNITLSTNWQNTGITGTMLTTGTYIVQALANDSSVGGGEINTYYSGIMSWYSGATSEGSYDEILLHRAGAASGSGTVYLQVLRAVGGVLSLQIAGNTNNSTTSIYYLNFRRML